MLDVPPPSRSCRKGIDYVDIPFQRGARIIQGISKEAVAVDDARHSTRIVKGKIVNDIAAGQVLNIGKRGLPRSPCGIDPSGILPIQIPVIGDIRPPYRIIASCSINASANTIGAVKNKEIRIISSDKIGN